MRSDPMRGSGYYVSPDIQLLKKCRIIGANEAELLARVLYLSTQCPEKPYCFATNKYFASVLGCGARRVQKMLERLKALGLILELSAQQETGWRRKLVTDLSSVRVLSLVKKGRGDAPQDVRGDAPQDTHNVFTNVNTKKDKPTASAVGVSSGEDEMVFMPTQQVQEEPVQHQFDMQAAEKLRQSILKAHKVQSISWSQIKWAKFFRLLRNDIGENSEDRITKVLTWYDQNFNSIEEPHPVNAKHFRGVFNWLERLASKTQPTLSGLFDQFDDKTKAKLKVTISDLKEGFDWPNGSVKELDETVFQSYLNYLPFFSAYQELIGEGLGKLQIFYDNVLYYDFHFGPLAFVRNWMEFVYHEIAGWGDFKGHLKKAYTFHVDSKVLARWGKSIGRDWDGYWDRFISKVKENMK